MTRSRFLLLVLPLLLFPILAKGQQDSHSKASKTDQQKKGHAENSKRIQLYRSLCLLDFKKGPAWQPEQVYGMHGQPWIVKKLNLDADTSIFLSTGFSKHAFRTWRAPAPDLIRAISSKRVHSVNDAKDGDLIVIIENVDWESADIVNLDISTFHKNLKGIHGSMDVRLKYENGQWLIDDPGGCQMREFEER